MVHGGLRRQYALARRTSPLVGQLKMNSDIVVVVVAFAKYIMGSFNWGIN